MTDKALAARLREWASRWRKNAAFLRSTARADETLENGAEEMESRASDLDRAADLIEQMAQAESVATVYYPRTGGNVGVSWMAIPEAGAMPKDGAKLYLAPPAREPLSEQEIWNAVEHGVIGGIGFVSKAVKIARAIEQAHGIRSEK
jgi:hypothetical protein